MTADKDSYDPGDVARLVLESPYQDARALVIVETPDGNEYSWHEVRGGSATVRLDVREGGSGSVRVPSRLERTRAGDRDEGTWETPGYDSADHKIEIVIEDLGSGDVQVR